MYAPLGSQKRQVSAELLRTHSTFSKSVMVLVAVSLLGTTELMFIEPGVKINGAYYRDVLLGQHLLPAIRSVAGEASSLTMLQLTELVTPWSFCLAIHQISSHHCHGRPIALTYIPWTMRCGACSSNASTIAGFATSSRRPHETASHRGEWRCFDQNIIDRAVQQWCVRLRACVRANGSHFEHKL